MEGRGFESHLELGFFRVPSGFNCNTFHLICVKRIDGGYKLIEFFSAR